MNYEDTLFISSWVLYCYFLMLHCLIIHSLLFLLPYLFEHYSLCLVFMSVYHPNHPQSRVPKGYALFAFTQRIRQTLSTITSDSSQRMQHNIILQKKTFSIKSLAFLPSSLFHFNFGIEVSTNPGGGDGGGGRIDRVFTPADSLFKGRGRTCIEYRDKPNMTKYRPRRRVPIFSQRFNTSPIHVSPTQGWTENDV